MENEFTKMDGKSKDDFHDSVGNYKAVTGQTDSEGRSTRANAETSGRYHTDWLNMMFPRLLCARDLLKKDGVIFISIDDNEMSCLKMLCNEVFGESNFLGCLILQTSTDNNPRQKRRSCTLLSRRRARISSMKCRRSRAQRSSAERSTLRRLVRPRRRTSTITVRLRTLRPSSARWLKSLSDRFRRV